MLRLQSTLLPMNHTIKLLWDSCSVSASKVIASNLGVGVRRFMLNDYGLEAAETAPIFHFTHIKSAELKNLTFVRHNHF